MRWLALLALTGCASSPYIEIGAGYQLDGSTDYWLQTDRSWQCSKNVQFHGEVGLELPEDFIWFDTIAIHHQSWWLCGGPFNHRPEVDTNDIRITKKWGGK